MSMERCKYPSLDAAVCGCVECVMRFDRPWKRAGFFRTWREPNSSDMADALGFAWSVPNRLHGAAINAEGDAV